MEFKNDQELINSLEDTLVKEFRSLQTLVNITKDERQALTSGDTDLIMRLVEEKEVLLDQLGLLEDTRRMHQDQLANRLKLPGMQSTAELFSHLETESSQRLIRLTEGISALGRQVRDLNDWNKAYAASTLEWLDAAQAFLLKLLDTNNGYSSTGYPSTGSITDTPISIQISRKA